MPQPEFTLGCEGLFVRPHTYPLADEILKGGRQKALLIYDSRGLAWHRGGVPYVVDGLIDWMHSLIALAPILSAFPPVPLGLNFPLS